MGPEEPILSLNLSLNAFGILLDSIQIIVLAFLSALIKREGRRDDHEE